MGALQVEAGKMPQWFRRKQLVANYWINVRGQRDDHPTKGVLLVSWEKEKAQMGTFGLKVRWPRIWG